MTTRELQDGLHEHYRSLLPDGLKPKKGGIADGYVGLVARLLGVEVEAASAMILDWFPQTASAEALDVIGAARGLQRFPGEYLEAFRNRVVNAYEFWATAGTVPGMLAALEHMGYGVRVAALNGPTVQGVFSSGPSGGIVIMQAGGDPIQEHQLELEVAGETFILPTLRVPDNVRYYELPPTRIIEHWRDDRSIWAEFSLLLTPSNPSLNADAWDDGSRWDDGALWDLTIRQEEVDRIRAVIGEIKPAHARLRGIYLVSRWGQDYWDDDTLWDDGTLWDADTPTTLYLRPGA